MRKESILANNIRVLRKSLNLSQEALAARIGVKRSNITAYESKNVEPRLKVILDIAKVFDISVKALISKKLVEGESFPPFDANTSSLLETSPVADIHGDIDITKFIDKSIKIRKVLEGFKAFYTFKKNAMTDITEDKQKLMLDIDNFIQLMEHLLSYNESVIKAIRNTNQVVV